MDRPSPVAVTVSSFHRLLAAAAPFFAAGSFFFLSFLRASAEGASGSSALPSLSLRSRSKGQGLSSDVPGPRRKARQRAWYS